ncbi:hypothetical protein C4N9_20865 [Pararhodobacter marinus]|uniref:DUF2213 domain-containing protein n=1 Tax=Pararhodobacter marinus TaxID=2184063 RepID=A0A2U2C4B7_9RHOB|nr:DUF2213 domain-containing protein [Pararhodobacter marinus]PWE26713.1 hypothetical protein C4N9_20865 [Pararhodobacter marinus]
MTTHRFRDSMFTDGEMRQTDDGWVVQARVARGGNVQAYRGSEMGLMDRDIVRVYRPAAEVFDRKAFQTYARKPITIGHPAEGVTPETWKDLAVGEIDRDVVRDGEFVSVPLLFRDAKAVALLNSGGPRELSMGYDASVEFRDGVTPDGEPYDAVMSDFRMNHVAVVSNARGGSELRIGDGAAKWGASPVHDAGKEVPMTLRKIMVDGLEVETTDAGAAAINKLTTDAEKAKAIADKALADAVADHQKQIAAKDAEIAKVEAERDDLKAKVVSDADLDKLVAARADLIGTAKAIADADYTGKSEAEIRKAAVAAKLGDAAVADKSDAYIEARFDILAEDAAPADPLRGALKDAKPVKAARALADEARAARHKSLTEGWNAPVDVKH